MRLVDNDRIAAFGYGVLPFLRLLALFFGRGVEAGGSGDVEQASQHEGELLQGRYDYLGVVHERAGELLGVLVYRLNHTLRVLDLVDGVLKLAVENLAVGYDQHAVEKLLVGCVVQAGKLMGEPGDAVRLAAACRVLNQVVVSGAFSLRC